jgi:DNA-binding response OmpR family regulator
MKILLIEDEKKIASFIRKGLEAQGFVVDVSHDGNEGFTVATTRPYDAIVLDIMLPGRDGLSILRSLRERKMSVPVILLTARGELNERLEGLNLGADDYLTKPFYIEELIARMHVVTRRGMEVPAKPPNPHPILTDTPNPHFPASSGSRPARSDGLTASCFLLTDEAQLQTPVRKVRCCRHFPHPPRSRRRCDRSPSRPYDTPTGESCDHFRR